MKATHVVITGNGFLEVGEKVYILRDVNDDMVNAQSVNPSRGDGDWVILKSKLAPIRATVPLENK